MIRFNDPTVDPVHLSSVFTLSRKCGSTSISTPLFLVNPFQLVGYYVVRSAEYHSLVGRTGEEVPPHPAPPTRHWPNLATSVAE